MHPPLHISKHPHCKNQIESLIKCHEDNPIAKFWGVCNKQKWALDLCLREQKNIKRLANKKIIQEREQRRKKGSVE